MKSIAAIILLGALLAQISSRYLVLLNFELNKNYIIKNLCVNRNLPMCGCNGKCFLKKQLAKSEKEENTSGNNIRVDKNQSLFFI